MKNQIRETHITEAGKNMWGEEWLFSLIYVYEYNPSKYQNVETTMSLGEKSYL